MSKLKIYITLLLCCLSVSVNTAFAGIVTLDTTFNNSGYRHQNLSSNGSIAESVAIQPDGKIIAGGWTFSSGPGDFVSVRVNANGSLDTSYNSNGIVLSNFGPFDRGDTILIQPDGKILFGGERYSGFTNNDFAIARYNPNGSLDNSFDGNGLAAPVINGFSDEYCYDMSLQNDGKIVMVGSTAPSTTIGQNLPTDIVIMRLNSDGSLDTTFAGNGKLIVQFQNVSESAKSVVIQEDGKIVIGGFQTFKQHLVSIAINKRVCGSHVRSDGRPTRSIGFYRLN